MSGDHHDGSRDLAWEALNDAIGAARLAGDFSLYLLLSRVMEARENGTRGKWAVELECGETAANLAQKNFCENTARQHQNT